jgi:hypothetical protein
MMLVVPLRRQLITFWGVVAGTKQDPVNKAKAAKLPLPLVKTVEPESSV